MILPGHTRYSVRGTKYEVLRTADSARATSPDAAPNDGYVVRGTSYTVRSTAGSPRVAERRCCDRGLTMLSSRSPEVHDRRRADVGQVQQRFAHTRAHRAVHTDRGQCFTPLREARLMILGDVHPI